MRANKIEDRESFKAWLDARPEATRRSEAVALAHRAAMRTAVHLRRGGKISLTRHAAVLTAAFRCNAISRVAATYPTREIATAADTAGYAAAASAAAADTTAYAAAADAARAAAAYAYAAFATASATASAYAAFASADTARAAYSWEEIRADAIALESGVTVSEVMATPLWRTPPAWWEVERAAFRQKLHAFDLPNHGFAIWAEWYDDVAFGKPVFGIRSNDIRATIVRNIALGSTDDTFKKEFWERDPPEINADIARWVEEARRQDELQRAIDEGNTEPLTDEDFRSRPASIQTMVRHGKVVLERDGSLTDLQTQTAEAATKDLAEGLRQIAEEARLAQADPRAVAFLGQCATAIEAAVHDQTKLFESGRNQKALETYAAIVDAEWGSLLSSRYSGLVAQFAQTLVRFDAWRAFVATPVDSSEPIDPAEMSNNVEAAVEALSKHEAAFSEAVLQRLRTLSNNFRLVVHRHQADDAAHAGWMQVPEGLQSDVAVSLSNVLLSYGQNVLQHVGPKILDGAMAAGDKAAFAAGALLVTASLGGALVFLQKKYPSLFGTVIKTIKKVRAVIKETEPE